MNLNLCSLTSFLKKKTTFISFISFHLTKLSRTYNDINVISTKMYINLGVVSIYSWHKYPISFRFIPKKISLIANINSLS